MSKFDGTFKEADHAKAPNHSDADKLLHSVRILTQLARASADLQADAVRAVRVEGISWSKIGQELGISRQAVQQRIDPSYKEETALPAECRILGPVARHEDLEHHQKAGLDGWRLVQSLQGKHVLRRDSGVWEVKKATVFNLGPMPAEKDGWYPASIRFPDYFYIRKKLD
ncbi:AsnC family protein [Glutamicibacter endophyticus]